MVVDAEPIPILSIRGVVSLLPGVDAGELPHIVAGEREYIAGEMMAFLVAWLASLPCRIINRPSPLCLSGPRLHHEQWLRAAMHAGLPIHEAERRAASFTQAVPVSTRTGVHREPTTGADATIACVDGHSFALDGGCADDTTLAGVAKLAADAGAGLLTAGFVAVAGQLRFAGAAPLVDASRVDVADAMLSALGAST